ncbi:MAG: S41 family peptidase, partial [Ginsengibacter sp.]
MYKSQLKTYYLFFLLAFGTPALSSAQINRKDSIDIKVLIDSLNNLLNNHYIFPEKALNISTYLDSQLKNKMYSNELQNPQKLAEQLQFDITKIHHDPHMHIKYDPGFHVQQNLAPSDQEIQLTKRYWKENNYSFTKVEIMPGNIGYIKFNVFVDDVESAKPTIIAALQFLSNTSAIIIDLRDNYGGSPNMVSQIESFFFKEKMHMNDLINRTSKDTTFFYADPAKTESLNLLMPVYILTSHNTFSGAEDFSYAMQKANRAVIVGETTGGGAHPQMPFSVGQGFVISIPYAR